MSGRLTREDCRRVFDQAFRAARTVGAEDVEVLIAGGVEALTRFANNGIHQNVECRERQLSVRVVVGGRTARASTNALDGAGVVRAVEEAMALARAMEADEEAPPMAGPEEVGRLEAVARFDRTTAAMGPRERAEAVAAAIGVVEGARQTAAGIYSTGETFEALLNSRGVEAYHEETSAVFSITAMAGDSSGWAKASETAASRVDGEALARSASEKAAMSHAPREIGPGHYTVVLEPAAVLDFVGQIFADFSATAIEDERSFLTGRLGERLFGDNIDIFDDAHHPLQSGAPFDGEGVARRRLKLVQRGVPLEVAYSRASAARAGVAATGHGLPLPNENGEMPANIVIVGGTASVEEMIATTERGVLVTRLWYIREVDPYEKILTGMTRDGTFLIEDGRLVCGLRNMRFNQSVIETLRRVEMLSPALRASGEEAFDMVAPAMKVRDFHFSEATRF